MRRRGGDGRRTADHVQPPDELARFAYGGDPLRSTSTTAGCRDPRWRGCARSRSSGSVQRTDEGLIVVVDDTAADAALGSKAFFASAGVGRQADHRDWSRRFDEIFVEIIEANTTALERAES